MKKRIPAMAMSALMLVNLATPAFAAENHNHDIDNKIINIGDIGGHDNDKDPWDKDPIKPDPINPSVPSYPTPSTPVTPEPTPEPEEEVNNTLQYYINLAGDILDTTGSASHYGASLFTDALTDEYTVNGKTLLNYLRNHSNHVTMDYDYEGIAGSDENDYEYIDREIRTILGNQSALPSDATILAAVKSQIDDGTNIYDINGDQVSSTLVSTDYYDIFWYVLKEGNTHWHVDGVLRVKETPAVTTYDVTYSWDNAPAGVNLPVGATYAEGDTVMVDTTYNTGYEVPTSDGKWIFTGWDHYDFVINCDVEIHGNWYFMPNGGLPSTLKSYIVTIKYLLDVDGTELKDAYTATHDTEVIVDVDDNVPATIVKDGITYDLDHIDYGTWVDTDNGGKHESTAWYTIHVDPEPDPVQYELSYVWIVRGGPGLPDNVTAPVNVKADANTSVSIDTTFTEDYEVPTTGGKYIFSGWDLEGSITLTEDTVINGIWNWVNDETPTPKTYNVSYSWTDPIKTTGGPGLPDDVVPPATVTYTEGDKVTIVSEFDKVYVSGGYYKFKGWTTTDNVTFDSTGKSFNITNDVAFVGSWLYIYLPDTTNYTLTIEYYNADTNQKIRDDYTVNYNKGGIYDATGMIDATIEGYTYSYYTNTDNKDLIGSMTGNITFKSYYTKNAPDAPDPVYYTVTYTWSNAPDGVTLPASGTYESGSTVKVDSMYVKGAFVEIDAGRYEFTGWMTDDVQEFIDSNGGCAMGEFKITNNVTIYGYWNFEANPTVTPTPTPTPSTEPEDPTPEVTPEPDPTPTPSTTKKYVYVTVKYVDENGNQIHDDYTLKIRKNRSYDVNDQIFSTIEFNGETYKFSKTSGALLVTNCCPNNVTITAHYEKETTEVPPTEPPVPDIPENPDPTPTPVIPEPENPDLTPEPEDPIAPTPVEPELPEPIETPENPDIDIPDPTPEVEEKKDDDKDLDEVPKTGDSSILALAISGMLSSIGGLHIIRKKNRENF